MGVILNSFYFSDIKIFNLLLSSLMDGGDSPSTETDRYCDLLTQKLLKLSKDPHYIELKR